LRNICCWTITFFRSLEFVGHLAVKKRLLPLPLSNATMIPVECGHPRICSLLPTSIWTFTVRSRLFPSFLVSNPAARNRGSHPANRHSH
jgi:hypothetical protein